ncbi:hypothetical protein F511_37704 [Dorcoceras hygrometricum]|uniref:Uncharacterized protein n=1 Tax=Dorcoceras hygrometricum TaxID=472368 RepID=A0A2Z7CYR2_9LAMI|nr:hypothetical protein F511_37704 [Dorcoceras hygrometricum]
MGRGRTKGKKLTMTNQDDTGSGEEEKLPAQKKRGRPQKSLKDEVDEEEARKIEEESSEDTSEAPIKDSKSKTVAQNGKKRMRNDETKEKADTVKEENGNVDATSVITEESNKSNGFRQNGSRRKSKPHRAAEAVVECN